MVYISHMVYISMTGRCVTEVDPSPSFHWEKVVLACVHVCVLRVHYRCRLDSVKKPKNNLHIALWGLEIGQKR